jgi:RimJ/RimL family protein N-acetyltransferase
MRRLSTLSDPILRDPPVPILTERLVIRPAQPGDGPLFAAAVEESRAELSRFLDWGPNAAIGEQAEVFMRRRAAAFAQRYELPLYTFDRETGEMVGECGLYGVDWGLPKFGLGYWCRSTRMGEGLTTEAVFAVTEWAFEHLDAVRVELGCAASNAGSRRVAEKCGFAFEGIFKLGRRLPDGVAEDRYNFAIVR